MSRLLVILLAFVLASHAIAADVRLKSVITAEPGLPVRLGDVAEITGTDAERLALLVVIDDPITALGSRRWLRVEPKDVRKAMQANSISTSRHTINGRACHIRVRTGEAIVLKRDEAEEASPETISLEGPETVRVHIARTLAHRYGVPNDRLRLLFDAGDESLLSRELAGVTAVIRPVSTALSDRIRVEVRLVRGERVIASETVTGLAQVQRKVVLLRSRLDRGATITRADLREDTRWLDPAFAAECASMKQAMGQRATNRLDPNTVLRTKDVEAPIAVRRGDAVVVLTVAGGVSIETTARALRDGVVGERIQCRLHRKSEPFEAVITGPGRALVNLDARRSGTRTANASVEGDPR